MAVLVSPFGPKPQFLLSTGLPAVGGQLFFYVAGSVSTKQNTYTDSTGGSANTNPLVLNALGEPTTQIWFTAGQSYKVVYAPSTDTDPPTSPIWTIDNLSGINDVSSSLDQWVAGPAPTYISATSFSLVGDQTSTFQVGRRVKTTNSGGTVYSTISISAFAAVTTITVVNDSSTLDSGLSAVSYGLLSATNPAIPKYAGVFSSITSTGSISGSSLITGNGVTASIASAAATTIFNVAARGRYDAYAVLENAGSTAYTAFATIVSEGTTYRIVANNGGNLTLTLSGSNIQVTQTSGSNQIINFAYTKMA